MHDKSMKYNYGYHCHIIQRIQGTPNVRKIQEIGHCEVIHTERGMLGEGKGRTRQLYHQLEHRESYARVPPPPPLPLGRALSHQVSLLAFPA